LVMLCEVYISVVPCACGGCFRVVPASWWMPKYPTRLPQHQLVKSGKFKMAKRFALIIERNQNCRLLSATCSALSPRFNGVYWEDARSHPAVIMSINHNLAGNRALQRSATPKWISQRHSRRSPNFNNDRNQDSWLLTCITFRSTYTDTLKLVLLQHAAPSL
jgi:hypothetical protein